MVHPWNRTKPMLFAILLVICALAEYGLTSTCNDYPRLPYDGLRHLYVGQGNELLQDKYLTPGWYRSCERLLTTDPKGINKCGTQFPVWLNGNFPESTTLVNVTACLSTIWDPCKMQIPVSIDMCDDNCFIYYLEATPESSGYCFGVGVQGDPPSFVPETPRVNSRLQTTDVPKYNTFVTSTLFVCDFVESTDEDLLYMVHWYKNGIAHYNTPLANDSEDSTLHITEDRFNDETFEMGMELSCSVTAFFVFQGPAGIRSGQSEKLFVGIKTRFHLDAELASAMFQKFLDKRQEAAVYIVLTPAISIDISTSKNATIQVQPTVQMGCQGRTSCPLGLTTYVPSTVRGECQQIGFESSQCGVKINSSQYNTIYTITVVAIDTGQVNPQEEEHYEIFLRTSDTLNNIIWGKYKLDPISVTITRGSGSVSSQTCSIVNDPHITTFDGRRYDDHLDRFYNIGEAGILYRNTFYNTEVQVLYRQCGLYSHIRCLCGVAVRAGQDVYVKQICSGVTMAYTFCSDNGRSFTVTKINDHQIKIQFFYGTYVKINENTRYSRLLTAEIYPSTLDERMTRGLCGTLDGNTENDFHYRDGTSFSSNYHTQHPSGFEPLNQPIDFIQEWSAKPDENLFNPSLDSSLLQPYVTSVCVCENNNADKGYGQLYDTIPCTPNGVTSCTQGKVLEANHCSIPVAARRRRSEQVKNSIPMVDITNRFETNERTKNQTEDVTWTLTQATERCRDSFESSEVYQACSQVPSVSSDNSISVCIADIQITGGTDWVGLALLDYASTCKEEVTFRNLTIVKQRAAGETMYDLIDNVTCPNDCSGRGQCVKGECICDEGAGLSDCSIDLTLSPELSGLYNSGLCDRNTDNCTTIYIFGGAFVDSINLICRVIEVKMDENGIRTNGTIHYLSPHLETYIELILYLDSLRQKRSTTNLEHSFVSGYSFSVTNNGQTYSDSADMFIYDSECQLAENKNGTLTIYLKEQYCFIENRCVINGDTNPDDWCLHCSYRVASTAWSRDISRTGCEELDSSNENDVSKKSEMNNVAVIAVATTAGIIIAVILVAVIVQKKIFRPKKVVRDSTLFDDPALMRSAFYKTNAKTKFHMKDFTEN